MSKKAGPSIIDPKAKGARRRRMTAVKDGHGYINGPNGSKVNYTAPGGLGPGDIIKNKFGKLVGKRRSENARSNFNRNAKLSAAFMANSRNGFRKKSRRRPSRHRQSRMR